MSFIEKLFGLNTKKPKKEREAQLKTVPMNISGYDNNHTLYHWHENDYMDKDGHVYEVKRKGATSVV